ncbi:50S ribosomal protein L10 [Candidatus Gottesmanbacteria bacterium]|nr:50S ribosomal protein L10 [Candidatus Gottesmanbacteria bacterium]
MATQKKIDSVTTLTEKVNRAKVMVLADYRGLKHKQLEELRRNLKKTNGEFMIAKNRLVLRALGDRAESMREPLNNETAILFAYEDEVAPLKEMLKFFKAAGLGKTKAGLMGTTVMSDADVTKLATLPSRDALLGKLVRQLNAPIQSLHYALQWNMNKLVWALNAVKDKKTS